MELREDEPSNVTNALDWIRAPYVAEWLCPRPGWLSALRASRTLEICEASHLLQSASANARVIRKLTAAYAYSGASEYHGASYLGNIGHDLAVAQVDLRPGTVSGQEPRLSGQQKGTMQ